MPKIASLDGVDIYMYFKDHAPPHVHAFYGDDEVLVVVRDGSVHTGSIPTSKLSLVRGVRGGQRRRPPGPLGQLRRWLMTLIKVSKVVPLDGFRLDLTFTDGTCGIADLSADLDGPLAALRDPERWKEAHVSRGVVVWNDDLDLAPEFLYARTHALEPPKTVLDVAANQMTVTMRELRKLAGKSQVEVAEEMGVAQAEVSRLEGRADTKLSTIERYVKALGGEVEVIARFGDRSMRLHIG